MKLINDFEIDIATAHSRLSKKWKNKRCKWSSLVEKCSSTKYTSETVREYEKMPRDEQSDIKDVGGFVGGYLSGGTRKTANVMWRSVATLDIDYGTADLWDEFTMQFDFAAILYSTHKHTKDKPRYRLVFPFNRQVKPTEYEPICRKIAEALGIDLFDVTTYQLPRLFYWPSTSKDGDFVFQCQDGPACDADEILSEYVNYKDVSTWPLSNRENDIITHEIKKAGDPLEKPGLIGAFCRAYTIEEAIDTFLSDVYDKTAIDGRYTYRLGTVAGGLVCYDDRFAYSHHETDPASRQLCNAFDLLRIHKFGVEDEGSRQTDVTKKPSYLKMQDFVAADKKVKMLITKEKKAEAISDFADLDLEDAGESAVTEEEENTEWMGDLDYDRRGQIKPSLRNIITIMDNDPHLAGRFKNDLFSGFVLINGGLPWRKEAKRWENTDPANLRVYLDTVYGISGKDKIKDATQAIFTKYRCHPIREYLDSLEWDGVPRLDRLIIDYIGAEDNELNRAMTRKHFTAAVARVMNPGCKYDYCLIIAGAEGIGKSTLFSVMGGEWFSDSLMTMEGKAGMEQARSGWVIELPELGGIKRSDVEQVKAYISRQNDMYRPAYGEVVEAHPRQCVFCGTTNERYFLKGDTGNRRFWVMSVDADLRKYPDPREALIRDRNQIWAEAVQRYKEHEPLYLSPELEKEARERQATFNDDADDPMVSLVRGFVDMKLPADWNTYDIARRRAYIKNPDPLEPIGTVVRTKVCAAEFICEQLGRDMGDKEYKYLARKVCKIMDEFEDWERVSTSRHAAALYGRQRAYRRISEHTKEKDEEDDI